MTEAHVIVDPLSLAHSASGLTTGTVHARLDAYDFPATGWNDFVVVVLGAICEALSRVLREPGQVERAHFMEGPFALDLALQAGRALRIRAVERREADHELAAVVTGAAEFARSVANATRSVLSRCDSDRIRSRDVAALRRALGALEATLGAEVPP